MQLGTSPDAFHEDALGARGALEIRHGPARRGVGQPVRADAPFLVGQVNVRRPRLRPPADICAASFRLSAFRSTRSRRGAAADRNQTTNPVPTR